MRQILRRFTCLCALLVLAGCSSLRATQDTDAAPPVTTQLVKTTHSWNGQPLPAYPQGQPEITMLRITIPAGARLHQHSHPVINAGLLLKGELTVLTTDGKTLRLKAGDPIVEVVNTLHHGINESACPAEIVVFYAGILGQPITVVEPE